MRTSTILLSAIMLSAIGLPAAAQYGRVERSQAEIAYEQAAETLETTRAERAEAIRSCGAKDYDACFRLGDMYRKGLGGAQDYKLSADAYKKACNGDHGAGCAGLGYLTSYGRGVDQNPVQARRLYEKSCHLDETSGCAAYGNMLYTGKGGRKDVAEGRRLLQDACDKEYDWACERLTNLGAYTPDDDTWERLNDAKSRY